MIDPKGEVTVENLSSGDRVDQVDVLEPELIFGLVGPLGGNIEAVQTSLESELKKVGYNAIQIHLSKSALELFPGLSIDGGSTYKNKIDAVNKIVNFSGKKDFMARLAIAMIAVKRKELNEDRFVVPEERQKFQSPRTAYIVRQLKREQEITTLEKVYGKKFIQISVAVSESEQLQSVLNIIAKEKPEISQSERGEEARKLVDRDREELDNEYGQGTINSYHSGDVFVAGNYNEISSQIARFIEAFFGSNFISPTKDEFGSYLAKSASLRTLDLSRQVGAAITSPEGDLITLGCNEVPKPGGGNYWCDDSYPQRDIERGVEPNKLETTRLIHNFIHLLSKHKDMNFDPETILKDPGLSNVLKDAFISDITEYGRITHAEMSALADAARLGRSIAGATIYVTTFPCHNCAKHLIAAGIRRIVYIEPYTKSKAFDLSGDALTRSKGDKEKVIVEHFVGISPKRFRDIFEKKKKRRDDNNAVKHWQFDVPTPMVHDKTGAHIYVEMNLLSGFGSLIQDISRQISEDV